MGISRNSVSPLPCCQVYRPLWSSGSCVLDWARNSSMHCFVPGPNPSTGDWAGAAPDPHGPIPGCRGWRGQCQVLWAESWCMEQGGGSAEPQGPMQVHGAWSSLCTGSTSLIWPMGPSRWAPQTLKVSRHNTKVISAINLIYRQTNWVSEMWSKFPRSPRSKSHATA